jgi:cell division GTPase FtsZ
MQDDSKIVKFIEKVSNGNEPLSLSYSDFFPIASIIDYRTIRYNNKLSNIQFSDYCRETTKKIILNINTNKESSIEQSKKIIELIRMQFNRDMQILLGSKTNDDESEITFDIVLYKD